MIKEYVKAALEKAAYKKLEDDTWFAEIQGFDGVWANAETVESCRNELTEVLEEWIVLKISEHDPLPLVNGLEHPWRKAYGLTPVACIALFESG